MSFGRAAIGLIIAVAVTIAVVSGVILFSFLRIVSIAEKAEEEVVPLVILQQRHAVMATDLGRIAEIILGARSEDDRSAALAEVEDLARRFALVADSKALARLDSAVHSIQRSAYRADVLEALDHAIAERLARLDQLVPFAPSRPIVPAYSAELFYEMRYALHEVARAKDATALEELRTSFGKLLHLMKTSALHVAEGGEAREPHESFDVIEDTQVIFDIKREAHRVEAQLREESSTARRLLAELSSGLSQDAAVMASASAADIVAFGRRGIVVSAVALGFGLIALFAVAALLLRHVVSPVLRTHAALVAVQAGQRNIRLPPAKLTEFEAIGNAVQRLADVLAELQVKEQVALRSQRQLQFVFDIAPVPCMMTRADTSEIVMANRSACALFQVESVSGRYTNDLWLEPADRKGLMAKLLQSGAVDGFEADFKATGGRRFSAVLSARSLEIDIGPVVLCAVHDITERKAYEARLQGLVEELGASNGELEQFAYVASHDLQEPLRLVTSYLQLLERKYGQDIPEDGREYIDFAVDAARRMQRLIIDLLEYSRTGRGSTSKSVDCGPVLEHVLSLLQFQVEDAGAVVDVPDAMPAVVVDPHEMERLFQNLISNALKYRAPDRPMRIKIFAEPKDGMWEFGIADNGIGIVPEHADRVFLIFQRLHGGGAYAGTGIGLAICRKIVEQRHGRIWCDTSRGSEREGEGCTFRFTLPAAEAKAEPQAPAGLGKLVDRLDSENGKSRS